MAATPSAVIEFGRFKVLPHHRELLADGQPNRSALGASPSQRQVPAAPRRDIQPVHSRLDQLLLQDAVASDPEEDRSLCHPLGAPQVQADASPDQGRERLVRPDTPGQPNTLCSLDVMSWQRPNIGSRVTREGHARFWERPEVKFLRATRQDVTPLGSRPKAMK